MLYRIQTMIERYPKTNDFATSAVDYHAAESAHKRKPRRAKWERLFKIACETINGHRTIEPRGHLEIVLSRIHPEPTPLYKIQRDRSDIGFISDPQARIFYLRARFGFHIENSIDHSVTPARSFYWLVVDESGKRPKMNEVEFAPEKDGRTNADRSRLAPATPATADDRGQFPMFTEPMLARSTDRFIERERGSIR